MERTREISVIGIFVMVAAVAGCMKTNPQFATADGGPPIADGGGLPADQVVVQKDGGILPDLPVIPPDQQIVLDLPKIPPDNGLPKPDQQIPPDQMPPDTVAWACDPTVTPTQPCYTGPIGTAGVGECKKGIQTCDPVKKVWGSCTEVKPTTEICDGKDNDCDTQTDEDFDLTSDVKNCGKCGAVCQSYPYSTPECKLSTCQIGCTFPRFDANKIVADGCECIKTANEEICGNLIDDDCDGKVDVSPCIDEVVSYDFAPPGTGPFKNLGSGGTAYDGWVMPSNLIGIVAGPKSTLNAAHFKGSEWIEVKDGGALDKEKVRYEFDFLWDGISGSKGQILLSRGLYCSTPRAWDVAVDKNSKFILSYSQDGSQGKNVSFKKALKSGTWYHPVLTFDGGTVTLAMAGETVTANSVRTGQKNLKLGSGYCPSTDVNVESFRGKIANFQATIWK
ncbi:MAG: MopE-related protein [Parcubacteria group bacterium]